jgi:hypothetical protein
MIRVRTCQLACIYPDRQQRDELKEIGKQLDKEYPYVFMRFFSGNKNPMKEAMQEIEHRITANEKGEDYKGEW